MRGLRVVRVVAFVLFVSMADVAAQGVAPVALECSGDGLISVVADQCMHDGGGSASGDSLEVYCYDGSARFCLSGEKCPWREDPTGRIDENCSRAGLATDWMASAWCDGWSGYHDFACSESGQIELSKDARADIPQSCAAPD